MSPRIPRCHRDCEEVSIQILEAGPVFQPIVLHDRAEQLPRSRDESSYDVPDQLRLPLTLTLSP